MFSDFSIKRQILILVVLFLLLLSLFGACSPIQKANGEECVDASYLQALYYLAIYEYDNDKENMALFYSAMAYTVDTPDCMPAMLRDAVHMAVVHKYMVEFLRSQGMTDNADDFSSLEKLADILLNGGKTYEGMWYYFCEEYPDLCNPDHSPMVFPPAPENNTSF